MKKIIVLLILMCLSHPFIFNGWSQNEKQKTEFIKIKKHQKGQNRSVILSDVSAVLNLNTGSIDLFFTDSYGDTSVIVEDTAGNQIIIQPVDCTLGKNQIDISSLISGQLYVLKIQNNFICWVGEFTL